MVKTKTSVDQMLVPVKSTNLTEPFLRSSQGLDTTPWRTMEDTVSTLNSFFQNIHRYTACIDIRDAIKCAPRMLSGTLIAYFVGGWGRIVCFVEKYRIFETGLYDGRRMIFTH